LFTRDDDSTFIDISEWSPTLDDDKDDCVWVKGEFLSRFLRLSFSPIEFDDSAAVDAVIASYSSSLLSNGNSNNNDMFILCAHGNGLYPSIAQRGKWIKRQIYDSIEQLIIRQDDKLIGETNRQHCEPTTVNTNFQCDVCSAEYSSKLQEKITLLRKLITVDELLDPSVSRNLGSDDEVRKPFSSSKFFLC
jgi:hypothetical protein